jgi:NAD(P)-dependent dehydrogenase (short-subunit alcohol dehydrogenase family)
MTESSRSDNSASVPRLVVVTGGNSGIGAACVARFRSGGDEVVVADRFGDQRPVDVTDPAAVASFFDGLPRPPGVLINAAGINDGGPILGMDYEQWKRVMEVNLHGAFLCLQAAARSMAGVGHGVIINMSSINDHLPMRMHAPYCVSKAGLSMLTRVAAIELGGKGVRVLAVAPGIIDTPLSAGIMNRPDVNAEMIRRTPLGEAMGSPESVANVVWFLASDDAGWMTGEVVAVDGGQQLLGLPDIARIIARPSSASV